MLASWIIFLALLIIVFGDGELTYGVCESVLCFLPM